MSIDLRCRHDRSVRELAAGMFDAGRGCKSVAKSLGIPAKAVREWQQTYRAVGRDGLPDMGEKHARYDFETKVAAARAVVDDGCVSSREFEQKEHRKLSSLSIGGAHAF
jgi:hypothetical protein